MTASIENLRLGELALVAEKNRAAFDDLVTFLAERGYASLHAFVTEPDSEKAFAVLLAYLRRPLPATAQLFDGIARPYPDGKAKWLLFGWVLRDAPAQRLQPMLSQVPGNTLAERQAYLLNNVRQYVARVFPDADRWTWTSISEVVIDRLEGSRRAVKGTLFEAIVRRLLSEGFAKAGLALTVADVELRLEGETFDVCVTGAKGKILMPVKTRETMGGGHALLFTRDIHKSIAAARRTGFDCLPVIIAESWSGDLATLECRDFIYINANPNQLARVEPELREQLARRLPAFSAIA